MKLEFSAWETWSMEAIHTKLMAYFLTQVVSLTPLAPYLEVDTDVDDEACSGVEDVLDGHDADEPVSEVVNPGTTEGWVVPSTV